MAVNVSNAGHKGAAGVAAFSTEDELYMNVAFDESNDVFITANADDGTYPWGPDREDTFMSGGTYPLGWTRSYGDGKVFVLLLGPRRPQLRDPGVPTNSSQRRRMGNGVAGHGGLPHAVWRGRVNYGRARIQSPRR